MATKLTRSEMALPAKITIRDRDTGDEGKILTTQYVRAKTRDLRKFGYNDLTEDVVREQIAAILAGEKLSVIGMFIEGDIVKDEL